MLIKYLLKIGADNFNNALISAASNYHNNVCVLLLEYGVNNYDAAIDAANNIENYYIVDIIDKFRC